MYQIFSKLVNFKVPYHIAPLKMDLSDPREVKEHSRFHLEIVGQTERGPDN